MKNHSILLILACAATLSACNKPSPGSAEVVAASAPTLTPATQLAFTEAPSLVPAPAPPVAPEHVAGKHVFDKTCGLCHGAGVGGAPRPGDKASWAPRIAQGSETLYQHALQGYSGSTGYMPPRGGGALADAEVKAGVDYMVAMSR